MQFRSTLTCRLIRPPLTLILRLEKTIFRRGQKLVGQIDWLILDSRCGHKWEGEQVAVALVQIPDLDLVPLFGFAAKLPPYRVTADYVHFAVRQDKDHQASDV